MNATPFQNHNGLLPRMGRGPVRHSVLTNPVTTATAANPAFGAAAARQGSSSTMVSASGVITSSSGHSFVNHNAKRTSAFARQPHASFGSGEEVGSNDGSGSLLPQSPMPPPPAPSAPSSTTAPPNPRRASSTFAPNGRYVQPIAGPSGVRSNGGGGGGGVATGFGIEGVRTGEEVVVNEIERRQPRRTVLSDPNRDDRKIKALQADLRALQDKLKKGQAARQKQKEIHSLMLSEMEARRALETEVALDRCYHQAWLLAHGITRSAHAALHSSRSAFDKQVNALQGRITEYRGELDKERAIHTAAAAQKEEAEAQRRRDAEAATQQHATEEINRLKAALEDQQMRFAQERQQLESTLAETQNQLRQSDESKRKLMEKVAEDMFLIAQCRLFVKNVCQPGFNVVKGPDLEPVDKDRTEPTGFVLVPLVVLLHGYALLPAEDRKEVIDHYEGEAAATSMMAAS